MQKQMCTHLSLIELCLQSEVPLSCRTVTLQVGNPWQGQDALSGFMVSIFQIENLSPTPPEVESLIYSLILLLVSPNIFRMCVSFVKACNLTFGQCNFLQG